MSAIIGLVSFDGRPVDAIRFHQRLNALPPLRPDRSDYWIDGPIAVGRRLLRLSPASAHEAAINPACDTIVVADAVLDNRNEVVQGLGLWRDAIEQFSDTDLITLSFERWGPDCVKRLLGDFAFAAVNRRTREVFLACDHIGSRPLFWAVRNQTLLFSTDIEALVGFDEWRWSIDESVIAEFLAYPLAPVSKPFFKEIEAVPAGAWVTVRSGHTRIERWWRPSTRVARGLGAADAVAECKALLHQAVADRINGVSDVGAHLSGGLDSSGVSVIAARQLSQQGKRLRRAYAWSPPISEAYPAEHRRDERARLQSLAQAECIDLRFGAPEEVDLIAFLDRPMEFEGEADLADEMQTLRAARADGIKLMLSGWGGDEAFSAHARGYLASLVFSGKFNRAKRFAHSFSRSLKRVDVLFSIGWRQILYPLLPNPLHTRFSPYRDYIRNASFMSRNTLRRHADLVRIRAAPLKFGVDPNANLKLHVAAGHITMRMRSWAAWSAPHGFQYRYPLTDRRLLEFLFALPPEHLFMDEKPRGLARRVLADCIPPSASKDDPANERVRQDAREAALARLRTELKNGPLGADCPWLDGPAMRAQALRVAHSGDPIGVTAFAELYAAARVERLWRRAVGHGWV